MAYSRLVNRFSIALLTAILLTPSAWALPPKIEAERLMLATKGMMDAKDYANAVNNFAKIESLKVNLPDTFDYHYGAALMGIGAWERALQRFDSYLSSSGSNGKFYKAALEKYNEAELRLTAARKAEAATKAEADAKAQAWALEKAKAEREKRDLLDSLMLVDIPAGGMMIGHYAIEGSTPQHLVSFKGFRLMKHELTQAQWRAVMGSNPSHFRGDRRPVDSVDWNDVQTFIRRLNAKLGTRLRLPSEAEWEYAASGGSVDSNWDFDSDHIWHKGNSGGVTHPVGQKQPNNFGLHDMIGNVFEWTQDCYNQSYEGAPTDGSAWLSGQCSKRVVRGYSLELPLEIMETTHRLPVTTISKWDIIGFRLAEDL